MELDTNFALAIIGTLALVITIARGQFFARKD